MSNEYGTMIPPPVYALAEEWANRCAYGSAYSIQIFCVMVIEGVQGILCLASTPQSCNVDNANSQPGVSPLAVTQNAGWWYYNVYWYPGMAMANWFRLNEYQKVVDLGSASEYFDRVFKHGRWRVDFAPVLGESYYNSLWKLLHANNVPYYQIVTAAPSWAGYRCLDWYVRVHVYGMPLPREEAWYVINLDTPWEERMDIQPTNWFLCKVFHAFGQKDCMDNWYLEPARKAIHNGTYQSDLSDRVFQGMKTAIIAANQRGRMLAIAGGMPPQQRGAPTSRL
jgi:hypothetical protein